MCASYMFCPSHRYNERDYTCELTLGIKSACSQLLMSHLLLFGMPDAEMSAAASHYASTIASTAVLVALQQNAWVHMAVPCLP